MGNSFAQNQSFHKSFHNCFFKNTLKLLDNHNGQKKVAFHSAEIFVLHAITREVIQQQTKKRLNISLAK